LKSEVVVIPHRAFSVFSKGDISVSTLNIQGIEALAAAAQVVSDSAIQRERILLEQQQQAENNNARALAAMALAARAAQQRHDDDTGVRSEELGQLANILRGAPAQAVNQNDQPAAAATQPTDTVVIVTQAEVNEGQPRVRGQYHPRNWSILAWIFAVIGLIIGLIIIGSNWNEAIFGSITSALIWVGGLGLGFCLGGLLGQLISTVFVGTTTSFVRSFNDGRESVLPQQPAEAVQPAHVVVVNPAQQRQVPPPPPYRAG